MNALAQKQMFAFLAALFCLLVSNTAYGEDVWTKGQLIENLKSGAVREITIVPGGIQGKYFNSYGREEIFFVPEKTPGEYSSFSPEIIGLIQKHGVQVIPGGKRGGGAFINYGVLFLQIASWIIIVIGAIMLIMINTKLKKILDILSSKQA
jgi:hypothetical protein